jgi:hypothetical protein
MTTALPTMTEALASARKLRNRRFDRGGVMTEADALDRVAQNHGFSDWSALAVAMADADAPPRDVDHPSNRD